MSLACGRPDRQSGEISSHKADIKKSFQDDIESGSKELVGVRLKPFKAVVFDKKSLSNCIVHPQLPEGLAMDSGCMISRTPLFASAKQSYRVTAHLNDETLSTAIILAIQPNIKEILSKAGSTYALLEDGTVMTWGNNRDGQLGIGTEINGSSVTRLVPGL